MPTSCCAISCANRQNKGESVGFFRIPKDNLDRRRLWLSAIKRGSFNHAAGLWEPKGHERLCGKHFIAGRPSDDPLDPDFVPSIFDFPLSAARRVKERHKKSKKERFDRALKRRYINFTEEKPSTSQTCGDQEEHDGISASTVSVTSESHSQDENIPPVIDDGENKELKQAIDEKEKLKEQCNQLEQEVVFLRRERDELRDELTRNKVAAAHLTDAKCKFFTGVPSVELFKYIGTLVSDFIAEIRCLNKEDQILLTLMKLRLGLKNEDLASRFHVSSTTVSEVINRCIPVLASRLRFLIHWPSQEEVRRNLPKKFRKRGYSNCRVIINCSEIFTERPYNLHARAKTWSNYKHHHTLKFLIGITPYGTVSFVSKCWGGRISDVDITARSGFYDLIDYGDMVMADRGFTISQNLAIRGATLSMPPFICSALTNLMPKLIK